MFIKYFSLFLTVVILFITKKKQKTENKKREKKLSLNPVVSFPGQGTVMWGQKTLLAKPSSFDRCNTRGLFNTLERSLSKMAKIFGPFDGNIKMKTSLIAGNSKHVKV